MNQAWFRFYEELNDFLPSSRKKQLFPHSFEGNHGVKDVIESLGVPHSEIDMILVNGRSVSFSYRVKDGDRISVYPVFENLDISGVQHLRPDPLRENRFILDVHLGKLSKYLRMLGYDTEYETSFTDNEIIEKALTEKRIILTRDKILLRNNRITHGYWVRSTDPREQAEEIIMRFDLDKSFKPFTRCMECNTVIVPVSKEDIAGRLLPKTREYYEEFWLCQGCGRIYWEGSHYGRMREFIEKWLK